MARTIKRYESRKLYDSEESRYVSLQEIAKWIRDGQEIEVIDNATSEPVTEQTLAQIILEEGKSGRGRWSTEFLHDVVRSGGKTISNGVSQVGRGLNRLVQASFDRLGPVKEARHEMSQLRSRLDELEATLAALEATALETVPKTRRRRPKSKTSGAAGRNDRSAAATAKSAAATAKSATATVSKAAE